MDAGDLQWFILFKSHWLVVIYYWESVYSIYLLKITVDAGKISYDCNQLLAILSWLGDL